MPNATECGDIVKWPLKGTKPSNFLVTKDTESLLVPIGNYVLTKRFSTIEGKKIISFTALLQYLVLLLSGYFVQSLQPYPSVVLRYILAL